MKCRFADMNYNIENIYPSLSKRCRDYLIPNESDCGATVMITDDDINAENNDGGFSREYLEFISVCRKISNNLPLHDAFLFHSAVFDVSGEGVALTAVSGTGKTTHMLLWRKLLGDKLTIVNGDKPFVRFFDNEPSTPYAYGTPWNGKEKLGCNMRTPLRHICFIERAEKNSCEKIGISDAINLIFKQIYIPNEPQPAANALSLVDRLLSSCDLWRIRCNMDISAAQTAYGTIFSKQFKQPN